MQKSKRNMPTPLAYLTFINLRSLILKSKVVKIGSSISLNTIFRSFIYYGNPPAHDVGSRNSNFMYEGSSLLLSASQEIEEPLLIINIYS